MSKIIGSEAQDILSLKPATTTKKLAGNSLFPNKIKNPLFTTNGHDLIDVLGSNDYVYSAKGNDTVYAGTGNDIVFGNEGNDTIYGDRTLATKNTEVKNPQTLTESIGEALGSSFTTDGYDDYLDGGSNNDFIHGERGRDTIIGGSDNDTIFGGDDDDILIGSSANGIVGEKEIDVLNGGGGEDMFVISLKGTQKDKYHNIIEDFNPGEDKIAFLGSKIDDEFIKLSLDNKTLSLIEDEFNGVKGVGVIYKGAKLAFLEDNDVLDIESSDLISAPSDIPNYVPISGL